MLNVGLIKLKCFGDEKGELIPIESKKDIPFEVKRIYYITNVPGNERRGFHSHRMLHQVLICLKGTVKIEVKSPEDNRIFELNNNSIGLYIGPLIWREMFDFSEDAVLLVLASEYYDEEDYLRDYLEYEKEAKKLFNIGRLL